MQFPGGINRAASKLENTVGPDGAETHRKQSFSGGVEVWGQGAVVSNLWPEISNQGAAASNQSAASICNLRVAGFPQVVGKEQGIGTWDQGIRNKE